MALKPDTGWNFFYTGWGTQPASGALATMQFFVQPERGLQAEGRHRTIPNCWRRGTT